MGEHDHQLKRNIFVAGHLKLAMITQPKWTTGKRPGWWFGTFGLFFHILGMS